MKFRPLWDADHPFSKAKMWLGPYSSERLKDMLAASFKYNKADLPNDYNLWVASMAGNSTFSPGNTSIDAKMSDLHPEQYPEILPMTPVLIVFAMYTNLAGRGRSEAEAKEAEDFFKTLDETVGTTLLDTAELGIENLKNIIFHPGLIKIASTLMTLLKPEEHVPISVANYVQSTLAYERVQNNPFVMSIYMTPRTDLAEDSDYLQWSVDTCDAAQGVEGIWPDFQWGPMGGKMCDPQPNAIPFRNAQFMALLYIHYDTVIDGKDVTEPKKVAHAQSERLRRGLVGTRGQKWTDGFFRCNNAMVAFPNDRDNVDHHVTEFFDSEDVYQRVLAIKNRVDPTGTFTANSMMVGGTKKFPSQEHGQN